MDAGARAGLASGVGENGRGGGPRTAAATPERPAAALPGAAARPRRHGAVKRS